MTDASVLESLFVTVANVNATGFQTRTLLSHTSQFLAMAEKAFGQRNHSYTLLGIQIFKTPDKTPHIWFPDSGKDHDGIHRHVGIVLGHLAMNDAKVALWQLAHECVHLIDPWLDITGRSTNYLEEGLATWFQDTYAPLKETTYKQSKHYALAKNLVENLMTDQLIPKAVRNIRANGVRIGAISPETLVTHCPETTGNAESLCSEFGTLSI